MDAGPSRNPAKHWPALIGPHHANCTGVARMLIIPLFILASCATVRARGTWAADSEVGTILTAAAIVVTEAAEVPVDGPWCDGDVPDPPHTCPAQVQDPR